MMRKIKVLVFKAISYELKPSDVIIRSQNYDIVEIEDSAEAFTKAIGCRYIDVVKRKIGKKMYNVICDDDGLNRDEIIISIFNQENPTQNIFGSVIITGKKDKEGEITNLTKKDVDEIVARIKYATSEIEGKRMISQVIVMGE